MDVPATAPTVAPQVPPAASHPVRLAGTPNVYVLPAGSPALVLRYDQPHNAFVPIGQLPPFSAVQALRVLRDHGLVEIRLTPTTTGFIDASRLAARQPDGGAARPIAPTTPDRRRPTARSSPAMAKAISR